MTSQDQSRSAIAVRPPEVLRPRGTAIVRFGPARALRIAWATVAVVSFIGLGLSIAWLPLLYVPLIVPPLSRAGIRRSVRRLEDPEQRATADEAIVAAARRPWFSYGDRLDALGHLLLARLERGDFDGACALVDLRPADAARRRRARTREHGFLGEVVFSMFGWLVPGHESLALATAVFRPSKVAFDDHARAIDPSLAQLISLHAVLEINAAQRYDLVNGAWNGIDRVTLRQERPVLHAVVLAALARGRPDRSDEMYAALTTLSATQRELVVRLYPEWASVADGAPYRLPAIAMHVDATSLPALVARGDVVSVWDRWFPARPTSVNAAMTIMGTLMLLSSAAFFALTPVLGLFHVAMALTLMFLPWVHSGGRRRRRLAPLRAAGIVSPQRLAELRRTATRSYPPTDVPDQMPFNEGELLLFTTLHHAEQAIADDDLERAVELLRPRLADPNAFVSPMAYGWAIAASWIRTSAIVGNSSGVARAAWFAEEPRRAARGVARSGHGNHPSALALAHSLAHALDDRWAPAAEAFAAAAARFDRIALDDGERRIYGELARGLQVRGFAIPTPLRALIDAAPLPALARLLGKAQLASG